MIIIGELNEPPSDELGGEIFISSRACMFITLYIWYMYVRTTRIVCAHSHLFLTLRRGNQITIETESERERDCTQRFIKKDKYTPFISTRATLLQRYLSAYNKDVSSNKVATLRSVQSRIDNIYFVMCFGKQQRSTIRSPFNVLHSVLVLIIIIIIIIIIGGCQHF